jgi:hypothetical protein
MSVARSLATNIGLIVGEDSVIGNAHLQSTFNGWLADTKKFHILAAAITWPRSPDVVNVFGIVFISKFVTGQRVDEILEDGEALEVRNDIEGWSPNFELPLQWVSFVDHHGITYRGIRPRPDPPIFIKKSLPELIASWSRVRKLSGTESHSTI